MTKEPTQGYVYILTNPSFKEDKGKRKNYWRK